MSAVLTSVDDDYSPDLSSFGADPQIAQLRIPPHSIEAESSVLGGLLLDNGADVNATDCDGWTCLFLLRSERVARYLLERGAAPGIPDQCGGLPEDWARVPMAVRRMLREWRTRG